MLWFNPSRQPSTYSCCLLLCLQWDGGVWKLMGWYSLIWKEGEGKKTKKTPRKTSDENILIKRNCSPPANQCPASPWATAVPANFLPHPVLSPSTMSHGMEHPLGQWGSAVAAVSPPSFSCTPSLLAGRAVWEADKALMLWKHCSEVTKTSLCYQHCLQHKSIQAAMKKINVLPSKTSTMDFRG